MRFIVQSIFKYYNKISNVATDDRQQTEKGDADSSAFP